LISFNVGAAPRVWSKKGKDRDLPLQRWMICGIFKTELRIFLRNIKKLYFHIGRQGATFLRLKVQKFVLRNKGKGDKVVLKKSTNFSLSLSI
jgi:hypothetical protein